MPVSFPLDFHFAYGQPEASATFRHSPEDFIVDECLGFEPSGDGEHIFLRVKKRNNNTDWVAKQLARYADVSPRDVGYCGLKDRHAVTTQWFSIYHPKQLEFDWYSVSDEGVWVAEVTRHQSKLRRGQHQTNAFTIVLRDVEQWADVLVRLSNIIQGVPNYFGEQRFGHDGGNLDLAERLLVHRQTIKNRNVRGMAMSAARSYLFNRVLSSRLDAQNWLSCIEGEPETFPSGPLWGRGRALSTQTLGQFEATVLSEFANWCDGLEHVGLTQERRKLVCTPQQFSYSVDESAKRLKLTFHLAPGEYATSVLREIVLLNNAQSMASSSDRPVL